MTDRLDHWLSQQAARWVAAVQRRAGAISAASAVLTVVLGTYAALTLGINSDNVRMLADTLPSKIAHERFARFFPNLDDALLIVIDGETPELARDTAGTLAARLSEDKDHFEQIYIPGGGSFFERNGLLYRSLDELDEFADQMAQLQPVLAELERDPSIESLAAIVRMGLDAVRNQEDAGEEWSLILDRVGNATVTIFEEFPIAISWEEVLLRGSAIEVTNRRVVIAHPVLDFDSILPAGAALGAIRELAGEIGATPEKGVTVRITGNPALNHEEMIGLAWDIGGAGVFCFLLVCGVLYLALRSLRLVIAAVSTLLIGLIWTAAFAAATVQQLNILSISFAVLFIGLGVDFAIHLGMRYADLLRLGVSDDRAMPEAANSVGSSLVICTFTTATGFYVFLPSDYRGVAELGLIAGSGMFIILALTLTTLPALLASWLQLEPGRLAFARVRFSSDWVGVLARHHRWIRLGAFGLAALGLFAIVERGAHFDSNVIRMRNPNTESVQAFDDLMEMTSTSPWYANLIAQDLDEARRMAAQISRLEIVDRVVTLEDYIPADQEEKLEILSDVAMILEAPAVDKTQSVLATSIDEQIEALSELAEFLGSDWVESANSPVAASMRLLRKRLLAFLARVQTEADPAAALDALESLLLSRLPSQIERLRAALSADGITRKDLPDELVRRMLAPTGEARLQVFPKENLQQSEALDRFVEAVRDFDPLASGVSVNLYDFGRATVSSFQQALVLAFVLLALLLLALWRNSADAVFALAPLLLSAILTVGAMAVLGLHFNFANVIVLPLLFGVGVDSGIHLVQRHRAGARPEKLLETTTARAVFYSAATTMVSFGTLAFSSHRGVATLGILLSIGMLFTVACNLVVLPALIALRSRPEIATEP